MTRKIGIFGGSGMVGRGLAESLSADGNTVSVFSRDIRKTGMFFTDKIKLLPFDHTIPDSLEGMDVVINLSGENIAAGRWTKKRKKRIVDSRLESTGKIVAAINSMKRKPGVYIQASAIGYYPDSGDKELNEFSGKGDGFLSHVVDQWENSSKILDSSVRRILLRFGVILSKEGGMLPKILLPMKWYAGGVPGKGKNWLSWVHHKDVERSVEFLIRMKSASGIFNICSPDPVRLKDFVSHCGGLLRRPVWVPVPGFMIKLVFGKMGEETILTSQKVVPHRLISEGYRFLFPHAADAVKDLLR